MNYRHIYHAGNICDVVKHAALCLLLDRLRAKEAAFGVLDTHAGSGRYDLTDERAAKTAEAQAGILALLGQPPLAELASYYAVLRALNPGWQPGGAAGFRFYPGSPLLTANRLRLQDGLTACELHVEDVAVLRQSLRGFRNVQIHHRDAYEALGALLPLPEKRGIILIDPPFEQPDEFARLPAALTAAHRRWSPGCVMLWYPIKERPVIRRLHEELAASGLPKILRAEFVYQDESRSDRLNGCGLILINPLWQMDERLSALFPALHAALHTEHRGSTVDWLTAA